MCALRSIQSHALSASVIVLAFSLGVTTPEAESITLRTSEIAGAALLAIARLAMNAFSIR
jgi:hypothetical protein